MLHCRDSGVPTACKEVSVVMVPAPCERRNMEEYLQHGNRRQSRGFLQVPALSESLQCQRTGRTDSCHLGQLHVPAEPGVQLPHEIGTKPQGWGCSSSTAPQPPHSAGAHPQPTALGQPTRSLPRPTGGGGSSQTPAESDCNAWNH